MINSTTTSPLWQLTQIFTGAPTWVWALFAFLLYVGLKATRTRETRISFYYIFPLLGLLTISHIIALPNTIVALTCFFASYILAASLTFQIQKRWILAIQHHRIKIAGEWLTFTTLMLIFALNFTNGIIEATSPSTHSNMIFIVLFSTISGLVSGNFLGRSLRVLYASRHQHELSPTAHPNKA